MPLTEKQFERWKKKAVKIYHSGVRIWADEDHLNRYMDWHVLPVCCMSHEQSVAFADFCRQQFKTKSNWLKNLAR